MPDFMALLLLLPESAGADEVPSSRTTLFFLHDNCRRHLAIVLGLQSLLTMKLMIYINEHLPEETD